MVTPADTANDLGKLIFPATGKIQACCDVAVVGGVPGVQPSLQRITERCGDSFARVPTMPAYCEEVPLWFGS